jgi:hypothetical protein
MNWVDIHKQKPQEFGYYICCDATNDGEYLGELLWKPDYERFYETKIRGSFSCVATVEEWMPNVTHWIKREDITLPKPGIVLELDHSEPLNIQLTRRQIEVFDGLLDNLDDEITDEELTILHKVRDKFFEVLENE